MEGKRIQTLATVAVALTALIAGAAAQSTTVTPFYPYPGVNHADHNDDHRGYYLTMREHELVTGVTVATATAALNAYLYQLTSQDDLIIFGGFYDTTLGTYVTSSLWRTEAGATASVNYALSHGGNYKPFLTQTQFYAGTVRNFFENEEIHSAVELGLYRQLRVSSLSFPTIYNATNIPQIVEQNVLPVAQALPGAIDYTTCYPTEPFANVFWMTEKSFSNITTFNRDASQLEPTIQQYLGHALADDVFYQGQISSFWHSAPGLTDPLPAGVSAPVMPAYPGTTPCSAAPTTAATTTFAAAAGLILAAALAMHKAL